LVEAIYGSRQGLQLTPDNPGNLELLNALAIAVALALAPAPPSFPGRDWFLTALDNQIRDFRAEFGAPPLC